MSTNAEQKRERRKRRMSEGFCMTCLCRPATVAGKCERCRERQAAYYKARHAKDAEYRQRLIDQAIQWRNDNPDRSRAIGRASRKRAHLACKLQAIEQYGKVCACCGESRYQFLTLDHANGDGKEHRAQVLGNGRYAGSQFTFKLRELGWPDVPGLRVLCSNCHNAIDLWGGCPHNKE